MCVVYDSTDIITNYKKKCMLRVIRWAKKNCIRRVRTDIYVWRKRHSSLNLINESHVQGRFANNIRKRVEREEYRAVYLRSRGTFTECARSAFKRTPFHARAEIAGDPQRGFLSLCEKQAARSRHTRDEWTRYTIARRDYSGNSHCVCFLLASVKTVSSSRINN